jgi:hypothetical protein
MDRILAVVTIAFLCSSPLLAANEGRASEGFQHTLITYHEDGYVGEKPITWVGQHGQFTNENVTMNRRRSDLGTGIGLGVVPMFGTYGVFRTGSNRDRSTYFALGFIVDELNMDETGTSDRRDDSGLSYGFGIANPSFNIEYMMSVDEENYEISVVGLSFISEF